MASLKEVKGRIATVNNTRKITSAMKMVASAKLHKAQGVIANMLPYEERLHRLLDNLLSSGVEVSTPYAETRHEVKRVALVVCSSNSSLCGGYNANVIKHAGVLLKEYEKMGCENILIYAIGKKVADALTKQGYTLQGSYDDLSAKPSFAEAARLAEELMQRFVSGEVDKVELMYNHFKSTSTQILTNETYLPVSFTSNTSEKVASENTDYILEPLREELFTQLVPKVLRLKFYTMLLDSNASEHAARTLAMQIATDNADDLMQELTLMYNKTRQQAITNELLDIVGGSLA